MTSCDHTGGSHDIMGSSHELHTHSLGSMVGCALCSVALPISVRIRILSTVRKEPRKEYTRHAACTRVHQLSYQVVDKVLIL